MERKCTSCKAHYPATTEYFYKANNKAGLRSKCKKCMNAETTIHRQRQDKKYEEIHNLVDRTGLTKRCGVCGLVHPATLEYFFKQSTGKHGLRGQCKKCFCAKGKQRKQTEEYREKNREYGRKKYHENKEQYARKYKKYYQEKREYHLERSKKYRENNPEKCKKAEKKYIENNIEKVRQKWKRQGHKKRANKRQAFMPLTLEQWQKCQEYFGGCCAYCGKATDILSQDHFEALSKGGEYTHYNIIPACNVCNSSKINKSFFDWYPHQDFYSKQRERKILKYLNIKDRNQQLTLAL